MENTIIKTAHQIIDEIAAKYTSNTRSMKVLNDSNFMGDTLETKSLQCAYVGDEDRTCAFGHMCIDPSVLIEGKRAGIQIDKFGQEILKPEYRGQSNNFYNAVQNLHDTDQNWDELGLSQQGQNRVEILKRDYK